MDDNNILKFIKTKGKNIDGDKPAEGEMFEEVNTLNFNEIIMRHQA